MPISRVIDENYAGGLEGGGEGIDVDCYVSFHLHSCAVDLLDIFEDEQEANL